jgi:hypothetical protein
MLSLYDVLDGQYCEDAGLKEPNVWDTILPRYVPVQGRQPWQGDDSTDQECRCTPGCATMHVLQLQKLALGCDARSTRSTGRGRGESHAKE